MLYHLSNDDNDMPTLTGGGDDSISVNNASISATSPDAVAEGSYLTAAEDQTESKERRTSRVVLVDTLVEAEESVGDEDDEEYSALGYVSPSSQGDQAIDSDDDDQDAACDADAADTVACRTVKSRANTSFAVGNIRVSGLTASCGSKLC